MNKQKIIVWISLIILLFSIHPLSASEPSQPTTLVFPPYLHTYGIRKATRLHLFILTKNKVQFRNPQGLAVTRVKSGDDSTTTKDDDEVTVYGVNSGQDNIIYNTSMTSLGVYGLNAISPQRLSHPHGIAANSDGDVYVADTGNNRIVHLYNSGNELTYVDEISRIGDEPEAFRGPKDVALDSQGNIYVADTDNNRCQVFGRTGVRKSVIGADGQLHSPSAIAVADRDMEWTFFHDSFIVVVDSNAQRLLKYSLQGKQLAKLNMAKHSRHESELMYLALDYYNNIYVTDRAQHCIHKLDRHLNYLTRFGKKGKNDLEFIEPRGIALYRRFGQVFIAEKYGAQYYWIGTDATQFEVSLSNEPLRVFVDYKLTEASFVTVDIFERKGAFVTRIWNKRFQNSGNHRDLWSGRIVIWPDSIYKQEGLLVDTKYKAQDIIPSGEYDVRYRFEPTYSSYHYFKKEIRREISIE